MSQEASIALLFVFLKKKKTHLFLLLYFCNFLYTVEPPLTDVRSGDFFSEVTNGHLSTTPLFFRLGGQKIHTLTIV